VVTHAAGVRSGIQTLRCVLVDDNVGFLDAATRFLSHQAITVVGVASTITDAIDSVARLRPDVTIVDINLRDESGFDLAELLVGEPVILTSTLSEDEFAELIASSPVLGFVSKMDLCLDAVRRLLDSG
jgi:two-component system, response regulator PdtaR